VPLALVLLSVLVQGAGGGTAAAAQATRDHGRRGGIAHGLGIRLMEAPVIRRKDPRARSGVVDHLPPGTVIKRRFEVMNTTRRPLHVDVYAGAATIEGHRFTTAPAGTPNELTTWTSTDLTSVDLPPGTRNVARLTIRVPKTAARGERYGVIWAQTSAKADAKHNLGLVNRVGFRLYLDIGPGGEPPSSMRIETLTPERAPDGRPRLVAQVRNTGGRALDISGALSLSGGPGGLRAGPYAAMLGVTLAPGDVGPVTVLLDKRLPNGPWKADLTLRSGLVQRTVSATVTFPNTGVGRAISLLSSYRLIIVWALMVLLIAAIAGALLLRRHRRSHSAQA
jgi:hypothetical protein